MKSVRVVLAVVALLALPFGSVAAQSSGGSKPRGRSASEIADCKAEHAAALARAQAEGHAPYGLDKKCSDPVPPPPPPPPAPPPPPPPPPAPPPPPPPSGGYPTGIHEARGVVYEDVDGNGGQDVFAGEMGLSGWTINLYWDGQLVATATTNAEGMYLFPGLGNSNKMWWVCVVPQAGYNRTQPANGTACSGNGVEHSLDSPFMTRLETNFGEMLP